MTESPRVVLERIRKQQVKLKQSKDRRMNQLSKYKPLVLIDESECDDVEM